MITTLNILFYIRREKSDRTGLAPLYCRLTVNGERAAFALHRSVHPSHWDSKRCRAKRHSDESVSINNYIQSVKNRIYDAQVKLQDSGNITAKAIKLLILGRNTEKSRNLFTVFAEHNERVKALIGSDFAHGTYERYATCLKHLKDFVLWKFGRADYSLGELNHDFIIQLDFYLRHVRKCSNNTTIKYLKNIRKIIKIAVANGWMISDPFINFKMKLKKVDRGYLNNAELQMLATKTFEIKRVEQVRDVFLFQCYTGLAYCDVKKLTSASLYKDVEQVYWIKTRRTKTNTEVNIPLLPQALTILEKYNRQGQDERLLPVPSNQKLNAFLKEVGAICGIHKRLSSHLARHTFSTTITLANGMSLEAVSKLLGHTNLNTTRIYARMLDTRVSREMQMLTNKLKDGVN